MARIPKAFSHAKGVGKVFRRQSAYCIARGGERVTKFEAIAFMESHGFKVHLELYAGTARIDDWEPMTVREFVCYADGFKEGMNFGYEGIAP
jgi:hypothetical protein